MKNPEYDKIQYILQPGFLAWEEGDIPINQLNDCILESDQLVYIVNMEDMLGMNRLYVMLVV